MHTHAHRLALLSSITNALESVRPLAYPPVQAHAYMLSRRSAPSLRGTPRTLTHMCSLPCIHTHMHVRSFASTFACTLSHARTQVHTPHIHLCKSMFECHTHVRTHVSMKSPASSASERISALWPRVMTTRKRESRIRRRASAYLPPNMSML